MSRLLFGLVDLLHALPGDTEFALTRMSHNKLTPLTYSKEVAGKWLEVELSVGSYCFQMSKPLRHYRVQTPVGMGGSQ